MFRIKDERREDWICFFCCHVRTATISIGLWQLALQIVSFATVAVMISNPDMGNLGRNPVTISPFDDDSLETPLPTPLSRTPSNYSREPAMNAQVNLIAVASTIALIYGACKGKPFYLLPYFCLKVFDFLLAVVIAISYLCALPSLTILAKQAEEQQGNEMIKSQLHNLNPSALGFATVLAMVIALYIKLYLLFVVWRCYRYLTLRRMSGRATVSVLGAPGMAELGPDYENLPAGAANFSSSASNSMAGPSLAPTTVAMLNPPEYSKIVKETPPKMPGRPETPPPPYASTLYLNLAAGVAPVEAPVAPVEAPVEAAAATGAPVEAAAAAAPPSHHSAK